jgi:hypothetical protein
MQPTTPQTATSRVMHSNAGQQEANEHVAAPCKPQCWDDDTGCVKRQMRQHQIRDLVDDHHWGIELVAELSESAGQAIQDACAGSSFLVGFVLTAEDTGNGVDDDDGDGMMCCELGELRFDNSKQGWCIDDVGNKDAVEQSVCT